MTKQALAQVQIRMVAVHQITMSLTAKDLVRELTGILLQPSRIAGGYQKNWRHRWCRWGDSHAHQEQLLSLCEQLQ
jgi:hypothetical protein